MKRNWTGRLLAAALALALSLSLAVSAAAEGVWPAGQSYEQDTAQEKVYAVRAESDGEDAEALRDRLLEAGFDAYLYRSSGRVSVLCGKFRDAEDALAYKTELADALEDVNLYAARAWLPAEAVDADTVRDGNVITGRALGAAIPFALEVIAALEGAEKAEKVKSSIVYNH